MNPFAGKSSTERNKMIAATVLGVLALVALFSAFGPSFFSSGTSVTVRTSQTPTPKPAASVPLNPSDLVMPPRVQQDQEYATTPVSYSGVPAGPEPGRNIFAFYEPPVPCGAAYPCPPPPVKTPPPPTPTPTPEIYITAFNPQSVYAGSRNFRIELTGERMQPDARVYVSQTEVRTTFVNEGRIVAEVPAQLIAGEGTRQILIQTLDGKKHSNQVMLNVQAPPKPQFQYIGMIARKRNNNDTAYFMEQGRQTPTGARLNDIVGGRFRLMSISAEETIFEDVNLGFKHKIPLYRPAPGTSSSGPSRPPVTSESYVPYVSPPSNSGFQVQPGQSIPGIPDNIPRYVPPNANRPQPQTKDQDDEDGDGKP